MSETTTEIPVPDLTAPLFAPFWKAASEQRLEIQSCASCGQHRWPPRYRCKECGSFDVQWVEREARGKLYSWTVVGQKTARGHSEVPYAVGVVELEGVPTIRLIGKLDGVRLDRLAVGLPLAARYVPAGDQGQMTLIYWGEAEETAAG
jgi:uncharacterized OB-fold protein